MSCDRNIPKGLGLRTGNGRVPFDERTARNHRFRTTKVGKNGGTLTEPKDRKSQTYHSSFASIVDKARGTEWKGDVVLGTWSQGRDIDNYSSTKDIVLFVLSSFGVKDPDVEFDIGVMQWKDCSTSTSCRPHGRSIALNGICAVGRVAADHVHGHIRLLSIQTHTSEHLTSKRSNPTIPLG